MLRRYRALSARRRARPAARPRDAARRSSGSSSDAVDARPAPFRALDRTVARARSARSPTRTSSGDRPSAADPPRARRPVPPALLPLARADLAEHAVPRGRRSGRTPLDLWLYQELIHDAAARRGHRGGHQVRRQRVLLRAACSTSSATARSSRSTSTEQPDRPEHPRITYLSRLLRPTRRSSRASASWLGDGKPLIVLDSSHRRDHVLEELRLWSPRVPRRLAHRRRGHARGRPPGDDAASGAGRGRR